MAADARRAKCRTAPAERDFSAGSGRQPMVERQFRIKTHTTIVSATESASKRTPSPNILI